MLAAAVGATQARGLIRLRRVPDVDVRQAFEEFPDCRETLRRMHREYVAPTEKDLLSADAVIVAAPAGFNPTSPEWTSFMELVLRLKSEGKLYGKIGAVVEAGDESARAAFSSHLVDLGFIPAPSLPDATALGRSVVSMARGKL